MALFEPISKVPAAIVPPVPELVGPEYAIPADSTSEPVYVQVAAATAFPLAVPVIVPVTLRVPVILSPVEANVPTKELPGAI